MFDVERVRSAVAATAFANVVHTAETESTNDDATALLGAPGSTGTTIVADFQRAGKGRRGRRWIAPPGSGLLFTTLLTPVRTDALWAVPFWAAIRIAEGITAVTGAIPTLQWPNDLLMDGRKVCGVLSVSRVSGEHAEVGCGVGINVVRPADDYTLNALVPAPVFLSDKFPQIDRETLLIAILHRFSHKLEELGDPPAVARRWEKLAGFPGAPYRLIPDGDAVPVVCEALRLDAGGALVARIGGYERTFSAADASALRTPDK